MSPPTTDYPVIRDLEAREDTVMHLFSMEQFVIRAKLMDLIELELVDEAKVLRNSAHGFGR